MTIPRLWFAALVAASGLSPLLEAADDSHPILRQTNYLAVLPAPGQPAEVLLKTQRDSPAYSDVLRFTLIGPDSGTVAAGEVPLGEEFRLSLPAAGQLQRAAGRGSPRAGNAAGD